MHGLLLRRHGSEGEGEHKEEGEDLRHVSTVPSLLAALDWVKDCTYRPRPDHDAEVLFSGLR